MPHSPPCPRSLIDWKIIRYAYLISGVVTTGTCLLAYFTVFAYNGIGVRDMAWTDTNWVSGASDLVINGRVYRDSDQVRLTDGGARGGPPRLGPGAAD